MSSVDKPFEHFEELGQLVSLLCEGDLSAEQSARLQQLLRQYPQARRYFLEYLQLHAELHWAAGMGREEQGAAPILPPECPVGVELPMPATGLRRVLGRWRWLLTAAGLLAAIGLAGVLLRAVWKPGPAAPEPPPSTGVLARWGQTSLPQWVPGSPTPEGNPELTQGQIVQLQSGFAELIFPPHTRVILEGPARLQLLGPNKIEVQLGRVSFHSLSGKEPFLIQTPAGLIHTGVEPAAEVLPPAEQRPSAEQIFFGLRVEPSGITEVHGFYGPVWITRRQDQEGIGLYYDYAPGVQGLSGRNVFFPLPSGEAFKLVPVAQPPFCKLYKGAVPLDLISFVHRLPMEPWAERLEAFRTAVAKHPALIHHYTFEGQSAAERRRDKKGNLHLTEVVMRGGRAERSAQFVAAPAGAKQWAFAPARSIYGNIGDERGEALQSEEIFVPPDRLTIELLVNFAQFPNPNLSAGSVGVLLATRADERRCSFLLAVQSDGELLQFLDTEHPWPDRNIHFGGARPMPIFRGFGWQQEGGPLIAGEWYYLATTFHGVPEKQTTLVNTYLANLTREESILQWVVRNRTFGGLPAPGRLGVGKGFDHQGRHAYPWPGLIDEIAIYRGILDQQTLQEHLELLLGKQSPR
ncbi:MAG: hypothetical protein NZ602_13935 [Thermoguttaceae bacterium]|nr:hypothetical protein [Thermoguttaceae bacterium]MDW8039496.1 hypothetical protein [Thermoguttaceae bacterium]